MVIFCPFNTLKPSQNQQNFLSFWVVFCPFNTLKPSQNQQNFLSFWVVFCPFNPPLMIPKIKTLKKKKNEKKCLEILSFYIYMCTINEDHMIYGSWNVRCNRQKFLSFRAILYPFSPLTNWEIKILTLKKTPQDIVLHICTINNNHMMYDSWDMEHSIQFFVILDSFLPFYSLWTQKIKIFKI